MKKYILVVLTLVAGAFCSCKQEGILLPQQEIMQLSVSTFWSDAEIIPSLSFNGAVVVDSMIAGKTSFNNIAVAKVTGAQRLQLKNLVDGALLVDTMLDVPGNALRLRFLQLGSEPRPYTLSAGDIDASQRNFGFIFTDPELPQRMTMELYNPVVIRGWIIEGADHLVTTQEIEKGKLNMFAINYKDLLPSGTFRYKLKNSNTGEYLPNGDTIVANTSLQGGGSIGSIITEQLNNISTIIFQMNRTVRNGGVIEYASGWVFQY